MLMHGPSGLIGTVETLADGTFEGTSCVTGSSLVAEDALIVMMYVTDMSNDGPNKYQRFWFPDYAY